MSVKGKGILVRPRFSLPAKDLRRAYPREPFEEASSREQKTGAFSRGEIRYRVTAISPSMAVGVGVTTFALVAPSSV